MHAPRQPDYTPALPSLADPSTRAETAARFARLSASATPHWGRFTAPQMLAHCADGLRMAYGDLPCTPASSRIGRFPPVRWLILDVLPFPKNVGTAPELVARPAQAWDEEQAALRELIERFAAQASRRTWPAHPFFGQLTGAQWGRLAWKHLDHHARQFGV